MSTHHDAAGVTLLQGDVTDPKTFASISDGAVRTIITSPPYFGLRDYGVEGQLGAETSVHEYVERLVAVFDGLRRVLADDGTLWLNLGDSYTGSWGAQGRTRDTTSGLHTKVVQGRQYAQGHRRTGSRRDGEPPAKNLLGVPWRVALALQDDGWFLRSEIIWSKPNSMPESVRDRPTRAHEHLFLLAKSPTYFYDADAIATEYHGDRAASRRARSGGVTKENSIASAYMPGVGGRKYRDDEEYRTKSGKPFEDLGKANKRTVWEVPTQPFPGSHFAVYPPELVRPCVRAGSALGDIVLDPFSGSGTTGMVAREEGRRYVGIDLNAEYLDLSLRTRFTQPAMDIWGGGAA